LWVAPNHLTCSIFWSTPTAATASSYGEVIFNQTNLNYTTGLNGSSLPLSTVFTVNASTLASANQVLTDTLSLLLASTAASVAH